MGIFRTLGSGSLSVRPTAMLKTLIFWGKTNTAIHGPACPYKLSNGTPGGTALSQVPVHYHHGHSDIADNRMPRDVIKYQIAGLRGLYIECKLTTVYFDRCSQLFILID